MKRKPIRSPAKQARRLRQQYRRLEFALALLDENDQQHAALERQFRQILIASRAALSFSGTQRPRPGVASRLNYPQRVRRSK